MLDKQPNERNRLWHTYWCNRNTLKRGTVHLLVISGIILAVAVTACTESPAALTPTSSQPPTTSTVELTIPPTAKPTIIGGETVATASPVAPILLTATRTTSTPQVLEAMPTWPVPTHVPHKCAIQLQVGTIDTRVGEPPLPDELYIDGYQPEEPGYYIVQFVHVILPEWWDRLDATGAVRLGYVPNNAFLVRMTDAQRATVAALDVVQWVGIYQPAYRISPELPVPLEGQSTLIVLTFPGADFAGIKAQLQDWGGTIEASSENEFGGKVRVTIDLRFVVPIARLNGVMWIESWVEPELSTNP